MTALDATFSRRKHLGCLQNSCCYERIYLLYSNALQNGDIALNRFGKGICFILKSCFIPWQQHVRSMLRCIVRCIGCSSLWTMHHSWLVDKLPTVALLSAYKKWSLLSLSFHTCSCDAKHTKGNAIHPRYDFRVDLELVNTSVENSDATAQFRIIRQHRRNHERLTHACSIHLNLSICLP